MYSIGWFSTGRDKAARDLLKTVVDAIASGEVMAKIAFVFCSREPGESPDSDRFIEQVQRYKLPLVCFSYQTFKAERSDQKIPASGFPAWRQAYDHEIIQRLGGFEPALCVLAGYMLIAGPELCAHYNMINLHPAAPSGPTGTWQEVVWQLIEQKAKQSGVMMHLVTPEMDRGPVVSFCRYRLAGDDFDALWWQYEGMDVAGLKRAEGEHNPLFRAIRSEGLKREFPLIISTIRAFTAGRVKIEEGRVRDGHGKMIPGYDLSREIDAALADI